MEFSMVEGRLIRLEENGYFLEQRLKELDQQLARQQAQLDAMEKTVQLIHTQLKEIAAILSETGKRNPIEEIPPHHVPRLW